MYLSDLVRELPKLLHFGLPVRRSNSAALSLSLGVVRALARASEPRSVQGMRNHQNGGTNNERTASMYRRNSGGMWGGSTNSVAVASGQGYACTGHDPARVRREWREGGGGSHPSNVSHRAIAPMCADEGGAGRKQAGGEGGRSQRQRDASERHKSRRRKKRMATTAGLEPTHMKCNSVRNCPLNHSGTLSCDNAE